MEELEKYLARDEVKHLTNTEKDLLLVQTLGYKEAFEYPIGRCLAIALIHFNTDVDREKRVNKEFINWLYYY